MEWSQIIQSNWIWRVSRVNAECFDKSSN